MQSEVTGDEPEDFDYDMPKIYEPVSSFKTLLSLKIFNVIVVVLTLDFTNNVNDVKYH